MMPSDLTRGPRAEVAPEVDGPPIRTSSRTPLVLLGTIIGPLAGAVVLFYLGTVGQSRSSGTGGMWWLVILAVALVVQALVGVLGWRFRTYTVGPTQLVIDEGILTRRRRVVPYDRVQQVDTHQNLIAQVFAVSELRVATAIASGTENVRLRFLDTPAAAGLRTYILDRRAALQSGTAPAAAAAGVTTVDAIPTPSIAPGPLAGVHEEVLLSLSGPRLALASVTHSSLLIGAFGGLVIGLWASAGAALGTARFQVAVLLGGGLLAALVIAAFSGLMIITRNLLERYGFTMRVRGDDLEISMGLLETRNITVPRRRVQQVTIVDNPIRRALGLVSLELHTASAGGEKTQFEVPLVNRAELDQLLVRIMGNHAWQPPPMVNRPDRARARAIRRRVIITALLLAPPAVILRPWGYLLLVGALVGLPWGRVAHRRAGYGLTPTLVALSHGVLHHRTELVPLARVQSCRTHASPFQRRATLATLSVDVAGHQHLAFGLDDGPHLFDMDEPTASKLTGELPRASLTAYAPA